jgi:predicted DNA-binding transcriptional regulator AlpA
MKKDDLIPLKVVAEEVGMSRTSLWRATRSEIPGFPRPVVIRRLVYWKRKDIERLDEALTRYRGRVSFERQRQARQKIERLKKKNAKPSRRPRSSFPATPPQLDLFDRRT